MQHIVIPRTAIIIGLLLTTVLSGIVVADRAAALRALDEIEAEGEGALDDLEAADGTLTAAGRLSDMTDADLADVRRDNDKARENVKPYADAERTLGQAVGDWLPWLGPLLPLTPFAFKGPRTWAADVLQRGIHARRAGVEFSRDRSMYALKHNGNVRHERPPLESTG